VKKRGGSWIRIVGSDRKVIVIDQYNLFCKNIDKESKND